MESWKIEKDLCRCCHSEGSFRALSDLCIIGGEEGFYNDMLRLTLNIQLKPVNGLLETYTYTICDSCVLRLRDATSFKQQVLLCEERFQDMYNKGVIKLEEPVIKQELPESEDDKMDDADLDDNHDTFEPDDVMDSSDAAVKIDLEICKADPEPIDAKRRSTRKKAAVKSQEKTKSKTKTRKTKGKPETSGEGEDAAKKDAIAPEEGIDYTKTSIGEKTIYTCILCDTKRQSLDSIHSHVNKRHYSESKIKCLCCEDTFKTRKVMWTHLFSIHGMEETEVDGKRVPIPAQRVACETCKKEFPSRQRLKDHSVQHQFVKCSLCDAMILKEKRGLIRHNAEVHKLLHYCGICDYKNPRKCLVIMHQRKVHLKERNVSCTICEAKFFGQAQLKKHMIMHNPVKKHECPVCKKMFPRKDALREHTKIHLQDKRKVCGICGERFVQTASLSYHVARRHPHAC